MRVLSIADLAYLAGFIDGEGTISIYRHARKAYLNGFSYRPIIEMSNTHLGVLEWARNLIGDGWLKRMTRKVVGINHRTVYRFRVSTTDCRWLLPQLRPHLKIKGQQADLLIQYFDRVTNTRPPDREFTEEITKRLNFLNRRGTYEAPLDA